MPYQGDRARPMPDESGRTFEVSRVRTGPDGHASDVLWVEVSSKGDRAVSAPVRATAAEVVDAIHDGAQVNAVFPASTVAHAAPLPARGFVVVEHADGRECITFGDIPSPGRNLSDMAVLNDD